jgi:uncharacterized membrane protein YgcG
MTRARTGTIVGLVLLAAGFIFPVAVAQADTGCDSAVIDTTSTHVLDQSAVTIAATAVDNFGADVRVRAMSTTPSGGLDAYMATEVQQCPSWRGPDGLRKANLITVLLSVDDRKSAIFYGSNFHPALDSQIDRVRADDANAQYKLGNYTAGIVNALGDMGTLINAQEHPGVQAAGHPQASPGTNSHSVAHVFEIIALVIGLIILFALLVVLWITVRKILATRSDLKEKTRSAQERARAAKGAVSDAYYLIEKANESVLAQAMVNAELVQGEARTRFDAAQKSFKDAFDALTTDFTATVDKAHYDPETVSNLADYKFMESVWLRVGDLATRAKTSQALLLSAIADTQKVAETTASELQKLQALDERIVQAQTDLTTLGYKPASTENIAAFKSMLQEAAQHARTLHFDEAAGIIQRAQGLGSKVLKSIAAVAPRHDELRRANVVDMARIGRIEESMEPVIAMLAEARVKYQPKCWADANAKLDQAKQMLKRSKQSFAQAAIYLEMAQQRFDEADKFAQEGRKLSANASSLVNDALSHLRALAALSEEGPQLVKKLRLEIDAARTKIGPMKGSHSSSLAILAEAERGLDPINALFMILQPDYLEIKVMAEVLLAKISEALRIAKSEHERIMAQEKAEADRKRRREQEEAEATARRRRAAAQSSSSYSSSFGGGYGYGSSFGSSSSSGGFGSDSGGGSSGGFGSDSGGGSSGGFGSDSGGGSSGGF